MASHSLTRFLRATRLGNDEGFTLIEAMFALVFLSIGLLAMAQMIPLANSQIVSSRNHTVATELADQTLSRLQTLAMDDAELTAGAHTQTIDNRTIDYTVADNTPVPGAKRIDLTVTWTEFGVVQTIDYTTIVTSNRR
jgi:Tfp pilus assembly protein PilV